MATKINFLWLNDLNNSNDAISTKDIELPGFYEIPTIN